MYFLKAIVLGFATLAAAQSSSLKFTSAPSKVVVGQTYDLAYTAADESAPVTITLKNGPSGDLKDVEVLTSSATGGSYSWTVSSYPDGQYALEIKQGGETNYWGPFPLTGGSASASSSAAASSSASGSSSSSATGYTSITLTSNSTMTMTGTAYSASGSGMTTMHRNITMSSATLKTKSTAKSASKTASLTKGGASSSSQASATTSHPGASSVPTGNAAAGIASPFALLFGVIGAMAYLN